MRSTGSKVNAWVDPFASSTESSGLTVADEAAVNAVTHSVEKTGVVGTRTVQLTAVAMETRLTPTDVVGVGHVPTLSVVLTWRRGAGVIVGAVDAVEAVEAEAMVTDLRGSEVPAVTAVLTGIDGTPVQVLATIADESPLTLTSPRSADAAIETPGDVIVCCCACVVVVVYLAEASSVLSHACAVGTSVVEEFWSPSVVACDVISGPVVLRRTAVWLTVVTPVAVAPGADFVAHARC